MECLVQFVAWRMDEALLRGCVLPFKLVGAGFDCLLSVF
jgi:hypothetical protein